MSAAQVPVKVDGVRSMGSDGDTGRAERVANWVARSTGPQKYAAIVGSLFAVGLLIWLVLLVISSL